MNNISTSDEILHGEWGDMDSVQTFQQECMETYRWAYVPKIVTRTITDGRTDGRTMAAGSSVTWTHYSVHYEVTWDKTLASARTRVRPLGRAASTPWMPRDYIRGPQTFHSHFLHRLGLEKLWCVWCTLWSGL
jgi:hypothetical protein